MLKRLKNPIPLAVGTGISAVVIIGASFLLVKSNDFLTLGREVGTLEEQISSQSQAQTKSEVLGLVALSPAQRASRLTEIAASDNSPDRQRARYLLASDLIKQKQGKEALQWLEGLEKDYPILAAKVAMKRAQAYQVMGDTAKANAAWKALLEKYPENPIAAEALFALGDKDAKLWDRAITEFPSYPRTAEIARNRLKTNPDRLSLWLLLLKHDRDSQQINTVLDTLQTKYAAQLKPEDWEIIAYIYWTKMDYGKAGKAYAKATRTPINVYRSGRGQQLKGDRNIAIAAYKQMVQLFPQDKLTGLALIRLAQLLKPQEALPYLDMAISRFPDKAGEALLAKAKILDGMNSAKSASEARQLALSKYADSEAVGQFRWSQARARAKAGDYLGAWQWAQPITKNNPDSELAPEASFWVGKWASRLGRSGEARTSFEYVLTFYPESYYAWRSAGILGLDVGTFNTVRQMSPQLVLPPEKPLLPAGSDAVKELYQLGQKADAWTLWQSEFYNYIKPTVAEQFTDGVLRLGVGKNISGITQVEGLDWWRDTPEDKKQIATLKQQPAYWHYLYPFPYFQYIENWSQQRQLNPLLVTALMRQESRFEPAIRSFAGATGLMQVMPGTAAWIASTNNIKTYALDNPNDNIKLGTWYLDHTHQTYNNNSLLAVASYNAGPGNVSQWIQKFGLADPDEFVEDIPFSETQGYVKHVFGNYWNYLRLYNPEIAQLVARYQKK